MEFEINSILECVTDSLDKIVLYRLLKKLETSKDIEKEFNMLLIHREYTKISNKINNAIEKGLIDEVFKNNLIKHYELLNVLLCSIDLNDEEKCKNLKSELIYLECLLDLPIHYFKTAKEMLDSIIEKEMSLKRDKNE